MKPARNTKAVHQRGGLFPDIVPRSAGERYMTRRQGLLNRRGCRPPPLRAHSVAPYPPIGGRCGKNHRG
jgi:hypothetical protein